MSQLSRCLLLFLVTVQSFVWAEEIVVLIRHNFLNFSRCNPCRLRPMNQPPFLFSYSALQTKDKHQTTFQLTLNKSKFRVTIDKVDSGSSFPFYQMKFLPDHRLHVYAILSSQGVANEYYHYFLRRGDFFHYLGHFPRLSYDRERKIFVATEKEGPYSHSSFYRFKENQLIPTQAPHGANNSSGIAPISQVSTDLEDLNHNFDLPLSSLQKDSCADGVCSGKAEVAKEDKQLGNIIICALNKVYSPPPPAPARMRLLQFILPGLEQRFSLHQVNSSVQKSHLLAQLIYESAGLIMTIESQFYSSHWQDVIKYPGKKANCSRKHIAAMKSDRSYFNHTYAKSKSTYRASFRGRGLIQLTHCYNYVAFFRHKAAVEKLSEPNLSASERKKFKAISQDSNYLKRDFFCQAISSQSSCNPSFCSPYQLKKLAIHIEDKEDLEIKPPGLIEDFESTVDILAVPCKESKVSAMTSKEFIVDSGLWYWKRCQEKYSDYIDQDSDKAVQHISKCVHGGRQYLQLKNIDSLCASPSKSLGWIVKSYCKRRKLFRALNTCFDKTSFARKN